MHKTSAWPLSLMYIALVVYASLYPFSGWRAQGVAPWAFLLAPLPRYWSGFDVAVNVAGYVPLGFLLALAALRGAGSRFPKATAVALGGILSLGMETLQNHLPTRVPSNVDLLLNGVGTWIGAALADGLEALGWLGRWSRFRARWFVGEARGGLVLLALWPLALLFPAAVPFGLGQVRERMVQALTAALDGTPWLGWLSFPQGAWPELSPGVEWLCVVLGLWIPCLLVDCVVRRPGRRAIAGALVLLAGLAASALSAALSYGPEHAWAWIGPPVRVGLLVSLGLAAAVLPAPPRVCAALLLLALGVYLSLLNQAPTTPYFAQTLSDWEQGRFIRFNGLALWLGWIWPYAVLLYVFGRIVAKDPKN